MKDKNKFNKFHYGITEWPAYSLNFWNIPKCAATAVKAALLKKNIDDPYAIHAELHSLEVQKFISREEATKNNFLNFTVIRHPFERIISMYKDFALRRPINNQNKESLADFDFFLDNIIVKSQDESCNPHFRSMSYYIQPDNYLLVDKVLNFSNIENFLNSYQLNFQKVNMTSPIDITLTEKQKEKIRTRYLLDFSLIKYLEA